MPDLDESKTYPVANIAFHKSRIGAAHAADELESEIIPGPITGNQLFHVVNALNAKVELAHLMNLVSVPSAASGIFTASGISTGSGISATIGIFTAGGIIHDVSPSNITTYRTSDLGWAEDIVHLIDEFKGLQEDWNRRSGKPVSQDSTENAKSIVRHAAQIRAPKPFVYPSPEGGIVCEFNSENRRLTLIIEDHHAFSFLIVDDHTLRTEANVQGRGMGLFLDTLRSNLNYLITDDGALGS